MFVDGKETFAVLLEHPSFSNEVFNPASFVGSFPVSFFVVSMIREYTSVLSIFFCELLIVVCKVMVVIRWLIIRFGIDLVCL